MNNKNFVILTCILGLAALISLFSYIPTRSERGDKIMVKDFPMQVGLWQAKDIPLSERDFQILETRNLFVRDYTNPDQESVNFYVVYSEDNRKASHPPEVCYMGSGLTIVDKSSFQLTKNIKATKMTVEKEGVQNQLVVYWLKAGKFQTDKYLNQQFKMVMDRTFGRKTSGALLRLSTDIKNDNTEEALERIREFAREIEPLVEKYIP
jgi:EpsI family protein